MHQCRRWLSGGRLDQLLKGSCGCLELKNPQLQFSKYQNTWHVEILYWRTSGRCDATLWHQNCHPAGSEWRACQWKTIECHHHSHSVGGITATALISLLLEVTIVNLNVIQIGAVKVSHDDNDDYDYDQWLWPMFMINDYDQWTYLCFLRPVPAVPHTGRVWKQVTGKTTIAIDGGWDDNGHEVFVDDVDQ